MNTKQRVRPSGAEHLPVWLSTSRLRSNFVAAEPPGTEDRDQQLRYPGNVGANQSLSGDSDGGAMRSLFLIAILLGIVAPAAAQTADRLYVMDCGHNSAKNQALWSPGVNVG